MAEQKEKPEAQEAKPAPKAPTYKPRQLHDFRLPTSILGIDVFANGEHAVAGCMDGVYMVNLKNGEHHKLYEHESYVSSVRLHEGLNQVVSGGYDGRLVWFDLVQKKVIREVKAHDFWSWRMRMSPDREWVASASGQYLPGDIKYHPAASEEPLVKVYNMKSGEQKAAFNMMPSVQAVGFSNDSRYVAGGNLMGEVVVWDLKENKLAAKMQTKDLTSWGIIKSHCYIGGIFDLVFSPDDKLLYIAGMGEMRDPMAGNGKQLWIAFDWRAGKEVRRTNGSEAGQGLMESLGFHPSGKWFAMGGRLVKGEWSLAFFNAEDGKRMHHLKATPRNTGIAFDQSGKLMVVSGTDTQTKPKGDSFKPFGRLKVYSIDA